jgi:hypothetical protein
VSGAGAAAEHAAVRVERLFDTLLTSHEDAVRQRAAAIELLALLGELSGFVGTAAANRGETVLPSGVALSALGAAECVTDFPRTAKFAAGLVEAVRSTLARVPGTRIEIVYAGCGPFALLALPLTTRFTADAIGFTLIDVHRSSIERARRLFDVLGIGRYVNDWVEADATRYEHGRPYHVLVSETMRRRLASEPQVAITLKLAPQLAPGGVLVPERIAIDAYLDDLSEAELAESHGDAPMPGRGRRTGVVELGTVFDVTASLERPDADGAFAPVTVEVPATITGPRHLVLATRIQVFGDVVLDDYESGLTWPTVLTPLGRVGSGDRVELRYVLGQEPGFRYDVLPPGSRSISR